MKNYELKPCPFCGGQVRIAVTGFHSQKCMFITRGVDESKKNCTCNLFMESKGYSSSSPDNKVEKIKEELVKAWNKRV